MNASKTRRTLIAMLAPMLLLFTLGCRGPQGPRVRFVTAKASELEAIEDEPIVWLEFQPGDKVPLNFVVVGVAEGGGKAIPLIAKKRFFLVMRKNAAPAFSWDGEHIEYANSGKAFIAVGHELGENRVSVLTFIGKATDMPPELKQSN